MSSGPYTTKEYLQKIDQRLDRIESQLSSLKVRVAGVASVVAIIVTTLTRLILR